jgi:putative nucleotidyltransferase with HDIG domain
VDAAVEAAIPGALSLTAKVAPERVRDELDKILLCPKPSRSLLLMERTGLLGLLIPELAACRGVEQKGFHRFDVLDHSLLACDYAALRDYPLAVRLAALYHDLGKPAARRLGEDGVWTFYGHERISARLTEKIMTRLRYPNAVTGEVCHLVAEHMFHYDDNWSDAAVRRFIIRAGEEYLSSLYCLRRCDAYGMTGEEGSAAGESLIPLMDRVETILAGRRAFSLKDLAVSGNDLIGLGMPPGKRLGIILGQLLEAVVEDPELNTRERLLSIAEKLWEREDKAGGRGA